MKRFQKVFNIILSLFIVLSLSGCVGLDVQLTSCLEQLSQMLNGADGNNNDDDGNNSKKPESIDIVFPEGRFSQITDTETYKDCYVLVNGEWADPSYDIKWIFNGETSSHKGRMYTFAPSATEESITVKVVLAYTEQTDELDENGEYVQETIELSDTDKFVYFDPSETETISYSENNGEKTYTVTSAANDVVEWFVNGEKQTESSEFVLKCKPGKYTVKAKVNGVDVDVPNSEFSISGAQNISNVFVDIDSFYPNIYISFDGDPAASYTVRNKHGSDYDDYTVTGNSALIPYSEFFNNGDDTYSVSVKTNDDGVYTGSLFSNPVTVTKPSYTAYKYYTKTYGFDNAYITDDEDFYEQFDYMMLTRPQPDTSETSTSYDFYFAYTLDGDINDLLNQAFDACGYTGSYRLGASGKNPYTVTISFKTGNVSDLPSTSNVPQKSNYAVNLNGYALAVSSEGRSDLPIDSKTKITVTNTDQLYRMAEQGYCPVPTKGSTAETVMNNARSVLSVITDEEMSDYEIALAVYDWLMYKNNYNNEVLGLTTQQAVKHPAFYLEGIIYSDSYGYSVCDGISKTYSLLCNMAGVECMRVVGEAGENGNWGGHAWNKIKIEGGWYIVDATWGDLSMGISYKSGGIFNQTTYTDYYELGMHNYFLVTDEFVKNNHKEDSDHYPKTEPLPYNHYANRTMTSGAKTVDLYLNETGTALKNKLDVIADAIISEIENKSRIQSVYVGEELEGQSYYFFYELGYSELVKSSLESYMSASSSFARKLKMRNYGFSLFEVDGSVGIIVSYYYAARLPSASLKM